MTFTIDEKEIISMYDTSDRVKLIARLKEILPHIDDKEMTEITANAISKLERMTDSEFAETEFESVFIPNETEG